MKDIHNIVLVGGTTKIPKIQEMLKKRFNEDGKRKPEKELSNWIDPEKVIAYGTALVFKRNEIDIQDHEMPEKERMRLCKIPERQNIYDYQQVKVDKERQKALKQHKWKGVDYSDIEIRRFFKTLAKETNKEEHEYLRDAIDLIKDFGIETLDDLYEAYPVICDQLEIDIDKRIRRHARNSDKFEKR